jgi:hypothetical protein
VERRTRLVLVGAIAALAVVGAGAAVWAFALRDTAEPASVDEAVRRFREAAAGGDTPVPAGVYVYATIGSESISALGGTTHRYPRRSTITVTPAPCGMTLRWDVLTTRSDTVTVCRGSGGQRLAGWVERHRFFGQDDRSDWRCEATAWLPAAEPGAALPYRCRSSDTDQQGTTRVAPGRTVVVDGARIDAVVVRVEAEETGSSRGKLTQERVLEPATGLPLAIEYTVSTKNDSPIGDVGFEERYTLRLLSLEPRR